MNFLTTGYLPFLGVTAPMFDVSDIFWILFILGLFVSFAVYAMKEKNARKRAAPRTVPVAPLAEDGAAMAEVSPEAGFNDGFGQEPIDFDPNFK